MDLQPKFRWPNGSRMTRTSVREFRRGISSLSAESPRELHFFSPEFRVGTLLPLLEAIEEFERMEAR